MVDDLLHSAWREGDDPELAVRHAREAVGIALNSTDPIDVKIARVRASAEPLLDAPDGNPMLVAHAARGLMRENQLVERTSKTSAEQRLRRRVDITVLHARGLHCGGQNDAAFRSFLAAWTGITNVAEGPDALLAKLANRPPNICAECLISIAGIGAASLRGADIPLHIRAGWVEHFAEIVSHYIPNLDDPTSAYLYPGTPSLVQVLYLLAEQRDQKYAPLVRALLSLDKLARPSDRRALATIPLREVAIAEYEGDKGRANDQSLVGWKKLHAHNLVRHIAVVSERRYMDPGLDLPDKES
jgi:hypothetical protein